MQGILKVASTIGQPCLLLNDKDDKSNDEYALSCLTCGRTFLRPLPQRCSIQAASLVPQSRSYATWIATADRAVGILTRDYDAPIRSRRSTTARLKPRIHRGENR